MTDTLEEWIEIYNPTGLTVDLSAFKIGDEETQGGAEGMFRFPDGASISPGQKIVVAAKAIGFYALYGFLPDYEVVSTDANVPDMIKYTAWARGGSIALANSGDEVLLLGTGDAVVDGVSYENGTLPGVIPHPGVPTGHSIERSPAGQDTDDCSRDFIDRHPPTPKM